MGKSTILMAIFNSYVSLPEGSYHKSTTDSHCCCVSLPRGGDELENPSCIELENPENVVHLYNVRPPLDS